MDFIEKLFGVSPDGGNGTLEAVYLAVVAVGVAVGGLGWRRRRAARRSRDETPGA
jgi:hypothetical protein